MQITRLVRAALFAAFCATAAWAADPSGTWKWTISNPNRPDAPGFESTLKLEVKDGALSGTITNSFGGGRRQGPPPGAQASGDSSGEARRERPEGGPPGGANAERGPGRARAPQAISDAKLDGDTLSFSVVREGRNGQSMTTKYSGTVDGDTIKGEITMAGRNGEERKVEWLAKRATDDEKPADKAPAPKPAKKES